MKIATVNKGREEQYITYQQITKYDGERKKKEDITEERDGYKQIDKRNKEEMY